jgi:hypothetical protein
MKLRSFVVGLAAMLLLGIAGLAYAAVPIDASRHDAAASSSKIAIVAYTQDVYSALSVLEASVVALRPPTVVLQQLPLKFPPKKGVFRPPAADHPLREPPNLSSCLKADNILAFAGTANNRGREKI